MTTRLETTLWVDTVAFELWSGALDAPEVQALIAALSELHPVAVSLRDGTWVAPDEG